MNELQAFGFIVRAGTERVRNALAQDSRILVINRERMTVQVHATSREEARRIIDEVTGAPADDVRIEPLGEDPS